MTESQKAVKAPAPYLNGRGQYKVTNPLTKENELYERVTRFSDKLKKPQLEAWSKRKMLDGVFDNSSYFLKTMGKINTFDLPKKERDNQLNALAQEAHRLGGGYEAADYGTFVHGVSERYMTNKITKKEIGELPEHLKAQLLSLRNTISQITGVDQPLDNTERIVLNTKYRVAGQYDMCLTLPDGTSVIADIKTGSVETYALPGFSTQLHLYASADWVYDRDSGCYEPMEGVSTDYGYILHMPRQEDFCTLKKVSLSYGEKAAKIYADVREMEKEGRTLDFL